MTEGAKTCIEALRKAARFGLIDCQCCPAYPMCPTGTAGWNNECMLDAAAELIESMSEQLEQVTRERDAAVKDLRDICRMTGVCCCCKNQDGEYDSNDCMDCIHGCNWQWRGVEVEE